MTRPRSMKYEVTVQSNQDGDTEFKISHHTTKWTDILSLAIVYASFILVVTAPIGFIISAIKVYRFKNMAKGSTAPINVDTLLMATHYEWLVRTFLSTAIAAMAAIGLSYYILGFIIGGFALMWWLYRLIRGIAALISYRPMPAIICTQAVCYNQTLSV